MALKKQDYINMGRADALAGSMNRYGYSSWQDKAYQEGYDSVQKPEASAECAEDDCVECGIARVERQYEDVKLKVEKPVAEAIKAAPERVQQFLEAEAVDLRKLNAYDLDTLIMPDVVAEHVRSLSHEYDTSTIPARRERLLRKIDSIRDKWAKKMAKVD